MHPPRFSVRDGPAVTSILGLVGHTKTDYFCIVPPTLGILGSMVSFFARPINPSHTKAR